MPRKPHFVLAARRWGWPLSPSYGRVRGLMTSVMGWKPKAETASCGFGSRQPGRAWRGTPRIQIIGLGLAAVPVAEEQANIVLTRAKLMAASVSRHA